jgi:hypothetical protein
MQRHDRRRRWLGLVALAAVAGVVLLGLGAAAQKHKAAPGSTATGPPPPASVVRQLLGTRAPPLVLTYFFYWYDAETGQHLRPEDGLPNHLPATPAPSWKSVAWFERQLRDMSDAHIDVALPVYWGTSPPDEWSIKGLGPLVEARHQILAAGGHPPTIGMFYDTSIIRGVNLTRNAGIEQFYANIRTFFQHVPASDWALVDNRPVIWLFLPQDNRFDQRVFDDTYARFQQDFGVRPFIVRATGWDCATTARDCRRPIHTDASYVWGVAQDGMQQTDLVAAAGPGYDDRQVAGREGTYVSRRDGKYYTKNLTAAVRSGRPMVAIETWNEIHEASGICETVEYGRTYIDLTRDIVDAARRH